MINGGNVTIGFVGSSLTLTKIGGPSVQLGIAGGSVYTALFPNKSGTQTIAMLSDISGGGGTVTSVATGTGLTGGPITTSGTISLLSGICTPGTYQSVTVDTYGRVTAGSTLTNNYQTIQQNKSSLTQRGILNFQNDFQISDDSSNSSTDVQLAGAAKLYLFNNL